MIRLRIQLLGPFQVERDNHLIAPEEWPGHKARQLLKILLTRRGHAVPADQLIEWLWSDLAPDVVDPEVREGLRGIIGDVEPYPYVVMG